MSTSKAMLVGICLVFVLIASSSAWSFGRTRGPSTIQISDVAPPAAAAMPTGVPATVSAASEQKVFFTVTSEGRGRLSTFNISVWTTKASVVPVGEFSFALRQIEQIGAHDTRLENYIDYTIPDDWNSSQKLTETVTVKEMQKNPVRAKIGNEPLFRRGVDYPLEVPFDEVEVQVDGVNYYMDVNETEYVAWVRLRENVPEWDIKQVVIDGWKG